MKRLFFLSIIAFIVNYSSAQSTKVDERYTRSGIESEINRFYQINFDYKVTFISKTDNEINARVLVFDKLFGIPNKRKTNGLTHFTNPQSIKSAVRLGANSKIITMHILDSIHYVNTASHKRSLFYYNGQLNCVKIVEEIFDSVALIWRPGAVTEFEYNARNLFAKVKVRVWSNSLRKWTNYDSHIYDYDSKGRITLYEYSEGTSVNNYSYKRSKFAYYYPDNFILESRFYGMNEVWIPSDSTTLKFDSQDRLIFQERFKYDRDASSYINDVKADYLYNSADVLVKAIQSNWSTVYNKWRYNYKVDYHKNYQGFDSLTIYSNYYGSWKAERLVKYEMTPYGKPTMIEQQHWGDANQNWIKESREDLVYDSRQREHQNELYIWDDYNNKYYIYGASRIDYIVNANDSAAIHSRHINNVYKSYFKDSYSTDSQVSNTQVIPSFIFVKKPTDYKLIYEGSFYLNEDTTIRELGYELKYYYSVKDTGSADVSPSDNSFKVFPNPTNDYVIIQYDDSKQKADLRLYDMTGRLVLNRLVASNASLSIKGVSAGIYIYKVYFGNKVHMGKLAVY
ncbi:MAG: T9SS type A sorting domain-containing protein [Bacteroidales bacterium]|nr:T9SS type A sorting domain-containing protein [Bacteroidales bacterium]